METLTGSGWVLRQASDSAKTLRAASTPPLSLEATSRLDHRCNLILIPITRLGIPHADGWCVQAPQLAGVQFNRPNTALGVQPTLLGQASPCCCCCCFLLTIVLNIVVVVFFLLTIDLLVTLFSFRVAPTSTSSTSLAVDQVFLFMNPSYLSNQHTHVGIYDNKHKFETFKGCICFISFQKNLAACAITCFNTPS